MSPDSKALLLLFAWFVCLVALVLGVMVAAAVEAIPHDFGLPLVVVVVIGGVLVLVMGTSGRGRRF